MKPAFIASCALSMGLLSSCIRSDPPSTPPPRPAWDWPAFPQADRLQVAQLPAHAGPARVELVHAPFSGLLRLTAGLASEISAGTAWGRIEPIDATADDDIVHRLELEITRRRQRYLELERPGVLAQLDRDLRDADEAAAAADFAEHQPALFTGERPALDPALRPTLPASQLAETARALRDRRTRIAAGDAALDPADLQAMRAELERRRTAREIRDRQSRLVMPFAGRLVLAEARDGSAIEAGETIALVADPTTLRIRVRAVSALLLAGPPAALEAEISLPGGAVVRATFAGSGFDPTSPGTAVLWFEAPAEPAVHTALGPTGADLPARIFARLPTAARIVPKLLVARADTQDALAAGWREAIPHLFPGARLVAEGLTTLAVQPPQP